MKKSAFLFVHPIVKESMSEMHSKSGKYVADQYQKSRHRPLLDWTKFPSFEERRYPGVETFPIIQPKKLRPKWRPLPVAEVEKRYKYTNGVQEEDFLEAGAPEQLKQAFSWNTASEHEIRKKEISSMIVRFGKFKGDTGAASAQIAVFTVRIRHLQAMFKKRKKDYQGKLFLGKLIKRRRGLLKYLMKRNPADYYETLKALNLTMSLEGPVFSE